MTYAQAKARGDTRKMHEAYIDMRCDLHKALAKYEYGWWSSAYRNIKKIMGAK